MSAEMLFSLSARGELLLLGENNYSIFAKTVLTSSEDAVGWSNG
jgi:hypothetical protein